MTTEPLCLTTHTAAETRLLGEELGRHLQDGDILCLYGELGAGKTTLTQGIARGSGCDQRVTSPTFTIVQEYTGRLRIYHLDCYRLAGPDDLEPLGADDWLGQDGAAVIEWPERVLAALPLDRLEVRLSPEESARKFSVTATGPRSRRLLTGLKASGVGEMGRAGDQP